MLESILAVATNGSFGGIIGGLFGGVQRVIEKHQDNKFKLKEMEHVLELHKLQHEQDVRMKEFDLQVTEIEQYSKALQGSYDHDVSFKPSTWVENIRALVRPVLTFTLVFMAWLEPYLFSSLASAVVMWWFASRVSVSRP